MKKLLSLPNLTKTQAFCVHEAAKVIVINKYKNFIFTIFQIMLPYFESFNNGQKLTVVSFILSCSRNHFFQKVGYRVLLA